MDEILVSELIADSRCFVSTGYARIKTTQQGKEKILKIPIKTAGIEDLVEALSMEAPRPPVITKLVEKDSEHGKMLGLEKDENIQMFDYTDENYVMALDKHNRDFNYRVIVASLDVDIKDNGHNLTDYNQKRDALIRMGITGHQIDAFIKAIGDLTRYNQERTDFLSGNG